jgi:hypothetical protein
MNLRQGNGQVPIHTGGTHPYKLVPFPSRGDFDALYTNLGQASRDKYYAILKARAAGAMLNEAGKPFGITKERVRQIESKFLRLMREQHG